MTRSQLITNFRCLTNHPQSVSQSRHRHERYTYQNLKSPVTSPAKPISPNHYSSARSIAIQPSVNPHDSQQQTTRSGWRSMTLISLTTLSIGYLVGFIYPPSPISQMIITSILSPAPSTRSPLPLDPDPQQITTAIEDQIHELPIVKELSRQPDLWSSFRPFRNSDPLKLAHSLTYSTLRGPGKFAVPPLVFINQKKTEAVIVIHVGDLMCGHDGIVHGGLLATICDEGLAALAFSNLPNHIGVTASLKLDYKKPVLANQFIILKSWIPLDRPPNGRKVWSNGRIENLSGDVLVEAQSLFIEPKLAKFISNSQIKDYM